MARDPITDAFRGSDSEFLKDADRVVKDVVGDLWEFRFELGILIALGLIYAGLCVGLHQDRIVAGVQLAVGVIALLSWGDARRFLLQRLLVSRTRRRWDEALRHTKIPPHTSIQQVEPIWSGSRMHLQLHRGLTFDAIAGQSEALAVTLRVANVRVRRDPRNASLGTVTLINRDPLIEDAARRWPVLAQEEVSMWDCNAVGMGEHGDPVGLDLIQKNLLVGGLPGAGKSVAMSMPIAVAALDRTVQMILIDGKEVELAPWAGSSKVFAVEIDEAISALEDVQRTMVRRLHEMRVLGEKQGRVIRAVERQHTQWPVIFIAIDELAGFTDHPKKVARDAFCGTLMALVSKGRAAGIVVIAATQKPEGSVVPTNLRDLFQYRWALRCANPDASNTILGRNRAAQGYDASTISDEEQGVGYLLHRKGQPERLRSFRLTDGDIHALATRAQKGRA